MKDLEDGTSLVRNSTITKSILKDRLGGLDRDEQVIQLLLNKSLGINEDKDLLVSNSNFVGRVLELSVLTEAGCDGIYMGSLNLNKTKKQSILSLFQEIKIKILIRRYLKELSLKDYFLEEVIYIKMNPEIIRRRFILR